MLEGRFSHNQGDFTLEADFSVESPLTALVGPSGAGKTTIANIVAGLIRPQTGMLHFNGETWFDSARNLFVPAHKRRIGYVFQEGRLFPHLNVQQNLEYGRRFNKNAVDKAKDHELINVLGIAHLLSREPSDLSGGEKSRVAIGRALFAGPALLIMDEPLAALDPARKAEILPHLEYIRDEVGIPILYVSHAMEEVSRLATHVIAVSDGKIDASGDPADVLGGASMPSSEMPAGSFLNAIISEILPGDGLAIAQCAAGKLYLRTENAQIDDKVRVHIPASEVMLANECPLSISALNRLQGNIVDITKEEHTVSVMVDCNGIMIVSSVTSHSADKMQLVRGKPVFLIFKTVSIASEGLFRQSV